jgi:hypothetical protein
LQALVAVVHMKQARMAVPAVVHLAQLVQMVLTLAVEAEHKLRVEPVVEQVQPLVLHCKVEARILVVMVVVVVVVVVVIGAAVVVQVPTLVLRVAAVRDT